VARKNWRKSTIRGLCRTLVVGPNGLGEQDDKAGEAYRLWLTTWVTPQIEALLGKEAACMKWPPHVSSAKFWE